MFPHERSLVKRLENKPFALVGINSDSDQKYMQKKRAPGASKDDLEQALKGTDWDSFKKSLKEKNDNQQITWRSFWNGPDGTGGPISTKWNVSGWPTLYVLDHKGVIRHKFVGSPGEEKMNKVIDVLVKEAETK